MQFVAQFYLWFGRKCDLKFRATYVAAFLFVCFVDLYAGHPVDFIWNLFTVLFVHFLNKNNNFHYYPTNALGTSPAHTCKEALPVAIVTAD